MKTLTTNTTHVHNMFQLPLSFISVTGKVRVSGFPGPGRVRPFGTTEAGHSLVNVGHVGHSLKAVREGSQSDPS